MGAAAIGLLSLMCSPTLEEVTVPEMIRIDESKTPSPHSYASSRNRNRSISKKTPNPFGTLVCRTSGF